jgi:hypothetical protein
MEIFLLLSVIAAMMTLDASHRWAFLSVLGGAVALIGLSLLFSRLQFMWPLGVWTLRVGAVLAVTVRLRQLRQAGPRLWAIATMTLLEAVRRKVFIILLLFAVALLSSVFFFPSIEVEGRLRLIEVWALRASALFTAIVGLFLAGFSLPQDFETKRIYMIVTKPVSKPLVFLGRYVGYAMLLALFIGTMGLITTVFLRTVKAFSSEKFPALVAFPRVQAEGFAFPGGKELEGGQAEALVGFGPDNALVWTFGGLNRRDYDEQCRVQARLIFGAVGDEYRSSGTVDIRVLNSAGQGHTTQLMMNTNEERKFEFPSSLIGADGVVQVQFRCGDSDGIIAANRAWLVLYEKSMSFELAFARGLVLILFQSLIVLSITLMASTFLSAPLSIILGILLYLVGSVHSYVREGAREIDHSLAEISMTQNAARKREGLPPGILKFSTWTSKRILEGIPDFANFDYSVWLLKDHAVSWSDLGTAGRRALPPIACMIVLGTLFMMFKDFDR